MRQQLHTAITLPIEDPDTFSEMGLKAASGVLLYGPPGEALQLPDLPTITAASDLG